MRKAKQFYHKTKVDAGVDVSALNPYVRYMDERICLFSYSNAVLAYDYRLFAVKSGSCRLEWQNELITLNKDSLIVFPPGKPYRLLFDPQAPAQLYDVNFGLNYLPSSSLAPDEAAQFKPERMPEAPDEDLFSGLIHLEQASQLRFMLGELLAEYEAGEDGCGALCSALLKVILLRALRQHAASCSRALPVVQQVRRYIEEHCRERLEAKELGLRFGYHPFYLNQLFRQRTGFTLHRYQTECRIRRACTMLACTDLSIREIADSLGFAQTSYFSETFKKLCGITPGDYRRANQSGA